MAARYLLFFITGALLMGQTQSNEIVAPTLNAPHHPVFSVQEVPADWIARMKQSTWHAGCPIPLDSLRMLHLSYWDFGGVPREGMLVVNAAVADDVRQLFQQLFEHGFMIERMRPVEEYNGNDELSMEANNTSAFNCRDVTGKPGRFSNHSWGRAIDINPLTNPMILHGKSLPPQGERYMDRTRVVAGSILDNSFIVKAFRDRGWTWGGEWTDPDYQHFEKPDPTRK